VPTSAVVVDDLTIRYGDRTAVDALSFTAERGEVVALLGPNGAGKTSTIEALEGYRRPSGGSVRVLDLDPIADRRHLVPHIGVMLQEGGLTPAMRPREAIHLYAAYYRDSADPDQLLRRLGLDDVATTTIRRLSGGERQRLSLALALVGRPSVVFLDEPTAGVDVAGRQVIRRLIAELRDEGCCVLLATHELDEAEKVAGRAVIVDQGRVVASGHVAELTAHAGHAEIRFGAPPGLDLGALGLAVGAPVVEASPGDYVVYGEGTPDRVARLTGWLADREIPLGDLRSGRARLEDVFLRLTTGEDST
jgi:ABC-2 type transport system ATP-binding protein